MGKEQTQGFQPERLVEARKARGLTQLELASRLDIKRQSLSAYEKGLTIPRIEMIREIANLLSFSFGYFFKEADKIVVDTIHFRKNRTAKEKYYAALEVRLEWAARLFSYLQKYVEFIPLNAIRHEEEVYSREELELLAEKTRKHWGLGMGPLSNVTALLENNGFTIARSELDLEGIDACSSTIVFEEGLRHFLCHTSHRSHTPISMVRDRMGKTHELAHFVLHSSVTKEDLEQNYKEVEHEADYFASAFLLPRDSFAQEAYFLTNIDDFVKLKERWKVSIQAMILRCKNLGIMSESTCSYLYRQINNRGWRRVEPFDKEWPLERPRAFNEALEAVVQNGFSTPVQIQEEVNIPAEELGAMCDIDPNYFLAQEINRKVIQLRPQVSLNRA